MREKLDIELAQDHVEWLLRMLKPLLIEEFLHGYKHGYEDGKDWAFKHPSLKDLVEKDPDYRSQ